MNSYSFFNDIFGLGFFGLFIAFVVWIILTTLTGYIFGIGIWAAMPSDIKRLVGAQLRRYEADETHKVATVVEG